MKTPLLVFFCLLFISAYSRTIEISPIFTLTYTIQGDEITFDIEVNKTSWVGIGFHEVGSPFTRMQYADMVIARFDGNQTVNDYYSLGYQTPDLDESLGGYSDIITSSSSQSNGITTFSFTRKLNTGDCYDSPFTNGTMEVVWALGVSNNFAYHGQSTRGHLYVDFFNENVCGNLQGCQSCNDNPACVYCNTDSVCYEKTNQGNCSSLNTTCASVSVCPNKLASAWTPEGFCVSVWAESLASPRGMVIGQNGDIIILEAEGGNRVTALWDTDGDGRSNSSERAVIASAPGLNHGVAVNGGYLYASNQTTLFRWPYNGQRTNLGSNQIVVKNIPCCHHITRSFVFDSDGLLYLMVGSASNVDSDTKNSQLNRFNISQIPNGGIDWNTGYIFAYGMRNEVGLTFDNQGRLWGVENGVDLLNRPDIGGDIHEDNPAEEVNLFDQPGKFYGYPYCWSEFLLANQFAKGKGSQWAHPNFMNDGVHTDNWCQNTSNVVRPKYSLPAHTAPLGIEFYYGEKFPAMYKGGAFVALHGSWNRDTPQGYKVVQVVFDMNGDPVHDVDILKYNGTAARWPNNFRPVTPLITPCKIGEECLFVTSDSSGQIVSIFYNR